ncbi:MAG: D-Ala-D-Ala carboxypeptidase family metallohydrolase [Gemmatimonadales bacterium]
MSPATRHTIALLALTLASTGLSRDADHAQADDDFSPEKAGFALRFKDEESPYRVIAAFVLPQEELPLQVAATGSEAGFAARAESGQLIDVGPGEWRWQAPQAPGLYPIVVSREAPPDSITLNVFVMVPYDELDGEYLNGYRIGTYPAIRYRQLAIYGPPRGFIEVTAENAGALVSPHFRLEQFLCKQESGWPKYVVLRERLLLKLEAILEEVNRRGYRAETFAVLSGYRTPYYNRVIGNVRYSRHVWGGAADIYIDESPRDGNMDDLNQDGAINYRDAAVLYDIIDAMYGQPWYARFVGGLGRYRRTSSHGPFVHVDVRGYHARWGT